MNAPRVLFGVPTRRTLAMIATLALAVTALTACANGTKTAGQGSPAAPTSTAVSSTAPTSTAPASPSVTPIPVHVQLLTGDGVTIGVGLPIVAYFSQKITDSSEFIKATTVKVNGQPAGGAWFFEASPRDGYPLEAHYRQQAYWPGHSTIQMNMPVQGKSGGGAFVFDDSLTLSVAVGAAHTATVDANTLRMTVLSDGVQVKEMPVSLGAAKTPTYNGIKVVEQKGEDLPGTNTLRPQGAVNMKGDASDPYNLIVPFSVRMTNSGEYIHAASWNGGNIGSRSTSNGCTNLNTADAEWYFNFALVGDPVNYVNTNGGAMPSWDGFGDWNVAWSTWQAGGSVQSTS